jgi:hypothetical protein
LDEKCAREVIRRSLAQDGIQNVESPEATPFISLGRESQDGGESSTKSPEGTERRSAAADMKIDCALFPRFHRVGMWRAGRREKQIPPSGRNDTWEE